MLKIELVKRVVTTKEGKSFDTFKAVQKNGKLIDCKFTKAVKNMPEESCLMFVEKENFNIDNSRKFPVMWVKKVEKYEELNTIKNYSKDDLFEEA